MDNLKKLTPLLAIGGTIAVVMWLFRRPASSFNRGYSTVPAIPQTAIPGVTTNFVADTINAPQTRGPATYPSTYSVKDLADGLINVGDHDSHL